MTVHPQMFPKPPRRMKQPRKDSIRFRAEVAEARLAYERTSIWWRIWHRIWARVVDVDKPARGNHLPPIRSQPAPEAEPLSGLAK